MAISSDDSSSHLLGEPLLGLISGDSLMLSELARCVLSSGDSLSGSTEDDVEVHTENTGVGVILNSEIDMLVDTESEVSYLLIKSELCFNFIIKKVEEINN